MSSYRLQFRWAMIRLDHCLVVIPLRLSPQLGQEVVREPENKNGGVEFMCGAKAGLLPRVAQSALAQNPVTIRVNSSHSLVPTRESNPVKAVELPSMRCSDEAQGTKYRCG